jgi:CRP/FNR family transcriptional regulator, cyclic AMP receptor protein
MKLTPPGKLTSSDLMPHTLFRGVPEEQLAQLCELIGRKQFPANAPLMLAEQAGEVIYFILGGTVKIHLEQADGSEVIISILGRGEIVGEMSALGVTSRSASVVTLEASTLLWLDRANFQRCLLTMPVLAYNLASILATRLRHANDKIQALATQTVETRIARQILTFAEQYGQKHDNGDVQILLRLTQSDLAAMTGCSREHVNKVIVSYKERGYLSVDRHYHFTIHNLPALARRA